VIFGEGGYVSGSLLIGFFYVGLTVFAYVAIWLLHGMRRSIGFGLLAGYACFVVLAVVR